jgi:hypothetical protein
MYCTYMYVLHVCTCNTVQYTKLVLSTSRFKLQALSPSETPLWAKLQLPQLITDFDCLQFISAGIWVKSEQLLITFHWTSVVLSCIWALLHSADHEIVHILFNPNIDTDSLQALHVLQQRCVITATLLATYDHGDFYFLFLQSCSGASAFSVCGRTAHQT